MQIIDYNEQVALSVCDKYDALHLLARCHTHYINSLWRRPALGGGGKYDRKQRLRAKSYTVQKPARYNDYRHSNATLRVSQPSQFTGALHADRRLSDPQPLRRYAVGDYYSD